MFQVQGGAYTGTFDEFLCLNSQLTLTKSVMVCNLSVTPASYEEPSATILRSLGLTRHLSQTRVGYKVCRSLPHREPIVDMVQVPPTQNGRGVFRVNQTPLAHNTSTVPTQDMFPAAGQQGSWYSQS